jgi:hypothetical protein
MRLLAILTTLIVHGLLLCGVLRAEETVHADPPAIGVRVLVLNFDPVVPAEQRRLHAVCGWHDPHKLADEYAADVKQASGGFVQYRIVDWRDLDEFPVKQDGFRYSVESYLACRGGKAKWHEPDLSDYPRLLEDYGAVEAIAAGKIDEVWIFGGPYFGFHESAMAGPEAFYINGGVYDKVLSKKRFAVMGYNYERGVAEMLHNLSHRTEATMSHVYGGWKSEELTSNWARFAANLKQSGTAAVGSCHYPPNGEKDYDYANPRVVESSASDWLSYPRLTGKVESVSCETWGGPDYHRNYMKWWFTHLPRQSGTHAEDGKLNNWWRYVFLRNE